MKKMETKGKVSVLPKRRRAVPPEEDFVSHNGNPENGDYGEYYRYLVKHNKAGEALPSRK